jgi:alanyl-tRNA synthetase
VDGVLPSNEGRGYVLRRILRRAIRHGSKLGIQSPFTAKLVQPLIDVMGDAYPELISNKALMERVLTQEENQFSRTLEQGLKLLKEHIDGLTSQRIEGEMAFKLYDTYGFPLDLTQDIAREHQLTVDLDGFETCMQQQRALSQSSGHFSVDYSNLDAVTETSQFHGYDADVMPATVSAILVDNQKSPSLQCGTHAAIVLDNTPFYAESGGQVGDKGQLTTESGAVFRVDDTQKIGQAIVHVGELISGELQIGARVIATVDAARRAAIRLNHTATHMLQAALKERLGPHVQQKGSLVDAERARFDFSHGQALSPEDIQAIEQWVNDRIRANVAVNTDIMDLEAAKQSGAMALFGEKYADKVRVLTLGDFSKELCGGTHALRTGDIGLFKIIAEYGVSSGIRRLEWVTAGAALSWVNSQLGLLNEAADLLKTTSVQVALKLQQLVNTSKQQEKELHQLKEKLANSSSQDWLSEVTEYNGIKLLIKQLVDADGQTLRTSLDNLKSKLEDAVIVLYSVDADKMQVIAGVGKAIVGRVPNAGDLVKHLCGRGGGRPDMAQGGGEVPVDLKDRLAQIKTWVEKS